MAWWYHDYGIKDLDQHWFRYRIVVWWHQSRIINWTFINNFDEFWLKNIKVSFTHKMHLKTLSAKCRPFIVGLHISNGRHWVNIIRNNEMDAPCSCWVSDCALMDVWKESLKHPIENLQGLDGYCCLAMCLQLVINGWRISHPWSYG